MSSLVTYCVLVMAASLAGGELLSLFRLTHTTMQVLVSGVAGLMLGIALFHMIPHAAVEAVSLDAVMLGTMCGLLTTFILIRVFNFHQHGVAETTEIVEGPHATHKHDDARHRQRAEQPPGAEHTVGAKLNVRRRMSWVGIGVGLTIHALFDGAALAASIRADAHNAPGSEALGFATFLAVFFHKPLDSMSITSLMAAAETSATRRKINVAYSLATPVGAALFWMGSEWFGAGIVGCALAFSAGVFLCISLSDLLPELQFHSHDRFKLSAALLVGVGVAWAIGYFEPPHAHARKSVPASALPQLLPRTKIQH
ncbi:MAG TPA: ZIP family metal transporter [Planctomycetaceae bacterium]|nr:ZIP family metal transporter [Planctomycetaceae bacterium]